MASTLANLVVRMSADTADITTKISRAEHQFSRFKTNVTRILGTIGVGIGAAVFTRMIKGALDAQDQLSKLSQKVGVSVESLVGLKHAADLSGVSFQGLQKGIKKDGFRKSPK